MKKLEVPYHSQLNNKLNPYGSCNVTSCAMAMRYTEPSKNFGKTNKDEQLEDFLYRYMEDRGMSRHSPEDLSKMMNDLGVKSVFGGCNSMQDIKEHIDTGKVAIVHGYFTSFGHIVCVVGYDDEGLICHDPYGVYPYNTDSSGAYVHYSYDMLHDILSPDGCIWAHLVGA